MTELLVAFCFHGISFDGVLYSDLPFDEMVYVVRDLLDHIEEDSEK